MLLGHFHRLKKSIGPAIGAAAPTLQIIVVKFGNFYDAHKFDDIAKMRVDGPAKYVHAAFWFV